MTAPPAARAVAGRAPGAAWTLMQRVDHPDPAAANAQALDESGKRRDRVGAGFRRLGKRQRFRPRCVAVTLARVLDGIDLDAGVAIDLNLSRQTRRVAARLGGVRQRPRHRPGFGRFAHQHQSDRGFCRIRQQPAILERAGARFRRRDRQSLPAPDFVGRLRSPTGASSTMPGARRRRNSPSRLPARWPICARSKREARTVAWRSMRRATRSISGCRPMPTSF